MNINELQIVEAEEREARERLEAHRARLLEQEGASPHGQDHMLLAKLEREWKHAVKRLDKLRHG